MVVDCFLAGFKKSKSKQPFFLRLVTYLASFTCVVVTALEASQVSCEGRAISRVWRRGAQGEAAAHAEGPSPQWGAGTSLLTTRCCSSNDGSWRPNPLPHSQENSQRPTVLCRRRNSFTSTCFRSWNRPPPRPSTHSRWWIPGWSALSRGVVERRLLITRRHEAGRFSA